MTRFRSTLQYLADLACTLAVYAAGMAEKAIKTVQHAARSGR